MQYFRAVESNNRSDARFVDIRTVPAAHEVRLELTVQPGRTCQVEWSSNLQQWIPFATQAAPVSSTRLSVVDHPDAGVRQRFYQAREQ